jgi:hypothetical protein
VTLTNTGADLTIGSAASGRGRRQPDADHQHGSGNVILTGSTNAAGDTVQINSAGAINGGGLVTAATVDLNAASGIGNGTALNLAASTLTADSSERQPGHQQHPGHGGHRHDA